MSILLFPCAGILGTGKSTLLRRLKETNALENLLPENYVVKFVQEPVDLWRAKGWLAAFYADPSQNAAAFQFLVFDSHVDAVQTAAAEPPARGGGFGAAQTAAKCPPATGGRTLCLIVERSMYCQMLFWKVQVENACASANPLYDTAYENLWTKWNRMIPAPASIFYFHTSNLEETMKRVNERDRAEEKQVSIEYQKQLKAKHDEWYTEPLAFPWMGPKEGIPCVHVNMDGPFHTGDESLKEIAEVMASEIRRASGGFPRE